MIAFVTHKKWPRLGECMFQYAFARMTARRLSVRFHFPYWIGDRVFCLDDEDERARSVTGIKRLYEQPPGSCGFTEDALGIADGTEIRGYFQSERYFLDKELVRKWFSFKEEAIHAARERYRHLDFSSSVSLHVRFGDKRELFDMYVPAKRSYYVRALSLVGRGEQTLVFSDEIARAKAVGDTLGGNVIYMAGNEAHEDLYLMSLCRDNICSNSVFSWWGAWLNAHSDKTVVCMKEWLRPGYCDHRGLTCDEWIEIKTVNSILGHYRVVRPFARVYRTVETLRGR
jgi:hypothetical protein